MAVSLLDEPDLLWPDEAPFSVRLAARSSLDSLEAAELRRDRRAHARLRDADLQWVRTARLSVGQGVSLVDLSAGGALIDSPVPLRPNAVLGLEIGGAGAVTMVQFRVLRCEVGGLRPERTTYRGACEFVRIIDLPNVPSWQERRGLGVPSAFVGLDLALKHLVERAGTADDPDALTPAEVLQALQALLARTAKIQGDHLSDQLGMLLAQVLPALEQRGALPSILAGVESQLRRSIPYVRLRLSGPADGGVAQGFRSIAISVPGADPETPGVSLDLPSGLVLNDWQSRLLKTTSRLLALLQRLQPSRTAAAIDAPPRVFSAPAATAPPAAVVTEPEPEAAADTPAEPVGWQKIVVRYLEGELLKGYTQDFLSSRPQFSIWPSVTAAAHERVIVPLARLKAVFFVRDFAGDPAYVERPSPHLPHRGRRIEVTLHDDEVIAGSTLSYRPDGNGFFVIPADVNGNNIRVFVVGSAVRQVRFP